MLFLKILLLILSFSSCTLKSNLLSDQINLLEDKIDHMSFDSRPAIGLEAKWLYKTKHCLPYISGSTFRFFCDHIYDETNVEFNPDLIKPGDSIFIRLDFDRPDLFFDSHEKDPKHNIITKFFMLEHPKIKVPYILVTHHSDASAPAHFFNFLDDFKLIAWFGCNCDVISHEKFIPIPIGIPNYLASSLELYSNSQKSALKVAKKYLVCLNFVVGSNIMERKKAYDSLCNYPWCKIFIDDLRNGYTYLPDYLINIAESKFVVSPHGIGLDCFRTWEALMMGAIPIVKTSTLDPLYKDLPVLIVDNWSDITEEFLNQQYELINNKNYKLEKIYFKYWFNLLKNLQSKYRAKA